MGRLINKRSETPKKKKASGKAAARKPTGKAVGRKSDIDTVKAVDLRAKKTVDACIRLRGTAVKRAARIADGDISEAEMEFLAEHTPQRQRELLVCRHVCTGRGHVGVEAIGTNRGEQRGQRVARG
jgi:hypothetical protein